MPQLLSPFRRIELDLTPSEVARRCRHLRDLVFFDTAAERGNNSEFSIVAAEPADVIAGRTEEDWEVLRTSVAARQIEHAADCPYPDAFAAGYVEYDGRFRFGFYDNPLIFDHRAETWHARSNFHIPAECGAEAVMQPPAFSAVTNCDEFCAMTRRAQEFIAAGDIYQVNLSHRFQGPCTGDAFAFYESLRHYSPAPYAAYLATDDRKVLCSSPESFLRMSGRHVTTRPIKGTRPRRSDPFADERSAYDLITSPKELAELVMITDLERNDLGQICDFGTVRVSELLKLERFEQVFHLVSTVEGGLRPEVDHVTALRRCFPGGSITGAPKRRAMEIIAELEAGPRGLYTGAIGWFGFNGESQFNVAIRTVVIERGLAHFHVGAGIVADSIPEKEWQETLDKAAGILLAADRLAERS